MDQIGQYRDVEILQDDGTVKTATCLEPCEDQRNDVTITMSRLPNYQSFLKWKDFCPLLERLENTCGNEWKRIVLGERYPSLCELLNGFLKSNSISAQNNEISNKFFKF